MSLALACKEDFDTQLRKEGQRWYYAGGVRLDRTEPQLVEACVDDGPEYSTVRLDWSKLSHGRIRATCSCAAYDDGDFCGHIWAAIQAVDARGLIARVPRDLELLHDQDVDEYGNPIADDDDDYGYEVYEEDEDDYGPMGRRNSPFQNLPPILGGFLGSRTDAKKPKNLWKHLLESLPAARDAGFREVLSDRTAAATKPRQAYYIVNVGHSLQADGLLIELHQRDALKNGGFGKLKKLSLSRGNVLTFANGEDRELLQMLLGNETYLDYGGPSYYGPASQDYYTYSRCKVSPVMYDTLLPRLCATGRCLWVLNAPALIEDAKPVVWDGGEPWNFRLRIAADEKKKLWRIDGQLCQGEAAVPLSDAVLLLSGGLVLLKDRLARLEATGHFPWIKLLRQNGVIEVPFSGRAELLQHLWASSSAPPMDLPPNLAVEVLRPEPQPRLTIKSPERGYSNSYLVGQVAFDYGDWRVTSQTGDHAQVDAKDNRVVRRSPEQEQRRLVELRAAGVRSSTGYGWHTNDVQLRKTQLPKLVRDLTAGGWAVECEGKLIRRPGSVSMSVASGVDWFELSGGVDFDGVSVSLPKLLAALRRNEQYIRLDDGTHGLLPEEWLKRFGGLVELGEAAGDKLKFAPSQALLLDALLAAQENVQVDEQFDLVRQKLRSFSGVAPADAPNEFTGQLRAYQRDGLGWLHFLRDFNFGGCLADDMGLGKTIQVLALLEARRTRPLADGETRRPSLVVVPKSLVFNWMDEAARFTPQLRVLNFTGGERNGQLERLDDYDLLITTYGTLRRDIVSLKDVRFDYAILDESQAIKNAQAQTAKACRLLKADHRLAMTGTPVENHLGELWSLFEFLNPGMLGRSQTFATLAKSTRGDDREAIHMLAHALRPFLLRRTKEQVLTELPDKTEQTLYCEMEPKQRKQYDELRDYYRLLLSKEVETKGMNKSKIHVLEALLRLRQVACHPGLVDKNRTAEPSAKLDLLLEQLDEVLAEGHKALVFSQFTSLLAIVREALDKRGLTYEYLDGQTNNRGERVKRFQSDPNCPLFLISLKAGGHGLNLTAADYVFILDPWWNPAVEAQAIDRAHRLGQERRVFAYRLICRDTVEDKILELQRSKRELADAIVSADDSLLRNLTAEDLQLLLS